MKTKIILGCAVILTMVFLMGCGSSDIPAVGTSKPLSQMTNDELSQMVDRYAQIMQSDPRAPGVTASGIRAIVYQNELILRALTEAK